MWESILILQCLWRIGISNCHPHRLWTYHPRTHRRISWLSSGRWPGASFIDFRRWCLIWYFIEDILLMYLIRVGLFSSFLHVLHSAIFFPGILRTETSFWWGSSAQYIIKISNYLWKYLAIPLSIWKFLSNIKPNIFNFQISKLKIFPKKTKKTHCITGAETETCTYKYPKKYKTDTFTYR